jgi:hypothetical protein
MTGKGGPYGGHGPTIRGPIGAYPREPMGFSERPHRAWNGGDGLCEEGVGGRADGSGGGWRAMGRRWGGEEGG